MNFPPIPLPLQLFEDAPLWLEFFTEIHFASATIFAGAFIFVGILLLLLWVPGADKKDELTRERITMGYQCIGVGIALIVTGIYGLTVVFLYFAYVILFSLIGGIFILADRDDEK